MTSLWTAVAVFAMVGLLVIIYRIIRFLLNDLAETPDEDLLLLTRQGWAAAIIFLLPIGGILYLTRGKMR